MEKRYLLVKRFLTSGDYIVVAKGLSMRAAIVWRGKCEAKESPGANGFQYVIREMEARK